MVRRGVRDDPSKTHALDTTPEVPEMQLPLSIDDDKRGSGLREELGGESGFPTAAPQQGEVGLAMAILDDRTARWILRLAVLSYPASG
jgi:hypothetical protein